jgi:hypothetical protein
MDTISLTICVHRLRHSLRPDVIKARDTLAAASAAAADAALASLRAAAAGSQAE